MYLPESDPAALFERIADLPWAVWLDSGAGGAHLLAATPRITLTTRGSETEICRDGVCERHGGDPLALLRSVLPQESSSRPLALPVAVGYFGYDLARNLGSLPQVDDALPRMAVGIYDWVIWLDDAGARLLRTPQSGLDAVWARLNQFAGNTPRASFKALHAPAPALDGAAYVQAFDAVQAYIRAGDCYQINLAQRFDCAVEGDPLEGYLRLRSFNPAPFSAYLNLPFAQVLSASPERFLQVQDGRVVTRPIKGTRPRAADPVRDAALAAELAASAKDRAENLMIVDLLRNDLGKVSQPGTVRCDALFEVESFASVHHLVSTVSSQLRPGHDAIDLLRAAFPGGSITGAPKRRAMQIIDKLEPGPRGLYCGAIGWIDAAGNMDSNIAIRTLTVTDGQARFWAGGGIVADSQVEREYQECMDKAAPLLRLCCG
jgi:para-aminobenzoate synthetase component 1